jgi:protein-S-isoprenylcysteine O-methyltransferase Ste14
MIDILVLIGLFLFYLLFFGRTIVLYRRGVKVWVVGTSSKTLFEIVLENILFPVLLLWSVFIVLTALNVHLPDAVSTFLLNVIWLKYVGILCCYAGLLIFLWALISFGKSWRIGIDEKHSNELITSGMFKYSRNPIFLFMDLYFFGIMLIYPNIVFVAVAICTIVGIHLQILREEKFLLKKFGEEYKKYTQQTRRYL